MDGSHPLIRGAGKPPSQNRKQSLGLNSKRFRRLPHLGAGYFEASGQSITNWVAQAELRKLRAENRVLRMEKDLLEKAAAFFAAKNISTR